AITDRVRGRLRRTAEDILAIGEDLTHAKAILGHGNFGAWLDREFGLSARYAEMFMAAHRGFGAESEAGSHLPAGGGLELASPSVPDELVDRVLAGEVPPLTSAIRVERATERSDERAYQAAGTFLDHLARFKGSSSDYAAGIAAHVLRRWKRADQRRWF